MSKFPITKILIALFFIPINGNLKKKNQLEFIFQDSINLVIVYVQDWFREQNYFVPHVIY